MARARRGCVRTQTRAVQLGLALVGWRRSPLREGVARALSPLRRDRDHRAAAGYRARLPDLPLPRMSADLQRADRHALQPPAVPDRSRPARRALAAPLQAAPAGPGRDVPR